jgi:hypothetical protein
LARQPVSIAAKVSSAPATPYFSTSDFGSGSVYSWIQSVLGFGADQRWRLRPVGILAGAIIVPIVLFVAATCFEGCFFLGSVFTEGHLNGKDYRLIGMSFVGDPMAWGFMILVPALIAVLKITTDRTITLVNTVAAKASDAWKNDPSSEGLTAAIDYTKQIWTSKARKPRKRIAIRTTVFLRCLAWIFAVLIWVYNTVTCALPERYYPYKNKQVKAVETSAANSPRQVSAKKSPNPADDGKLRFNFEGRSHQAELSKASGAVQTIWLAEEIPLKKWDCQRKSAPLSCWLTRCWTLVYYGVIPFLVVHLILLIWGATSFLWASTHWEESKEDRQVQAVEINPFHPDGFGGLGALSDAVIGYLYSISCFAVLVGLAFLKEGNQPAWHDYAFMLLVLPLGVAGVLLPSMAVRHTIVCAKNRYLGQLAGELHTIGDSILKAVPAGKLTEELTKGELDKQKAVKGLYDDVKHMSEWPFSATTLLRMIFPIAAPWLPAILKEVAKGYIK